MHSQRYFQQACAALLAVAVMITLAYLGFQAKQVWALNLTVMGKLSLSLLSLSVGFALYAKIMRTPCETLVAAWPYYLILLLTDLVVAQTVHVEQGIQQPTNFNVLIIVVGALMCGIYAGFAKLCRFKR